MAWPGTNAATFLAFDQFTVPIDRQGFASRMNQAVAVRGSELSVPPTQVPDACDVASGIGRSRTLIGHGMAEVRSLPDALPGELGVSRPGTLTAAIATYRDEPPLIVLSVYGLWEKPHKVTKGNWIYADASVHRIVSDLSALVGRQNGHRILVAGDLNVLYGYGEHGSSYWAARYETTFRRMAAIGLKFVGPQMPHGRCADPWPVELPRESQNVPTYHTSRQTPGTATRQLDLVIASAELASNASAIARNEPEDWGPSDHCCVEIQVA